MTASTLKLIRQTHLYFGVFISPAILFFAFTGALQSFSLHETTKGRDYKPPAWAVKLGYLHKHQSLPSPPPPPAAPKAAEPAVPNAAPNAAAKPVAPAAKASPPGKSHLPMKLFFLTVCIGLFTSTLTGITMAYKYKSNKLIVTGLLIAGMVVPLLLLAF